MLRFTERSFAEKKDFDPPERFIFEEEDSRLGQNELCVLRPEKHGEYDNDHRYPYDEDYRASTELTLDDGSVFGIES